MRRGQGSGSLLSSLGTAPEEGLGRVCGSVYPRQKVDRVVRRLWGLKALARSVSAFCRKLPPTLSEGPRLAGACWVGHPAWEAAGEHRRGRPGAAPWLLTAVAWGGRLWGYILGESELLGSGVSVCVGVGSVVRGTRG